MCHGGLDPKYAMRDIDARVKALSYQQDTTKQDAPAPHQGLVARLTDALKVLLQKDKAHV